MRPPAAGLRRLVRVASFLLVVAMSAACGGPAVDEPGAVTLVFKHSKLFGDPAALDGLIEEFTRETAIRVRRETLPSSSDEQHQFYAINLNAATTDFDVFAIDVVWVAEFAQAGWLRDLTHLMPPAADGEFFPGPLAAVQYRGRRYALPWFVDAGLLYYRKDLLARYGLPVPQTWNQLAETAGAISRREPDMYGFVWQGKQYEGLVCNVLEHLWSGGGEVLRGDEPELDSAENVRALRFARQLIDPDHVTPEFVTTLTEESSRTIFGSGRAVFLRNWPYAWSLFQREGSEVKDKVGVTVLPHYPGHRSAATLGGWQLAVNAGSHHPEAAEKLASFLASARAQKALAVAYGLSPPRRTLYSDSELLATQPFLAQLATVMEGARPRPVTPRYVAISQVLQAEFSAAVSGARTADEALRRAQHQIVEIMAP
jgi:multiple sugar transport system substrate-binding protein